MMLTSSRSLPPTLTALAALTVLSLSMFGCDDGHDHEHDKHSGEDHLAEIIAEACLHFGSGPETAVTAGADAASAPVAASIEHMRLDVTLPADPQGGFKGVFAVDLDEAGEFVVVSSQAATLRVSNDAFQTALEFEAVTYAGACDGNLQGFDGTVGRHTFELSSDSALVSIVIEHAGDDHAH